MCVCACACMREKFIIIDLGVFAHAGGSAVFIASDREVFSFSSVEVSTVIDPTILCDI